MNIIEEAFAKLKKTSFTEDIDLKKVGEAPANCPGEKEFAEFVNNCYFERGVKHKTEKYLAKDNKVIFTLEVEKDYLSEYEDDFEVRESDPDIDYDPEYGYSYSGGGGYYVEEGPDEEDLIERLCDEFSLPEDSYSDVSSEDNYDYNTSPYNYQFLLHGVDEYGNVDVRVKMEGEYSPATRWEPAEYPTPIFSGDCDAHIILYFEYAPYNEDEEEEDDYEVDE